MLLTRIIKYMVISRPHIIAIILIAVLGVGSMTVFAAEPIPDCELATLYGGNRNRYYHPYCSTAGARDCPRHTCGLSGHSLCRYCVYQIGKKCKDAWSDTEGDCWDDTQECKNALPSPTQEVVLGFCSMGDCIEVYDPGEQYPDCNNMSRDVCEDS